ncbi:hypothetical protein BCR42DRAFT_427797 [Absidia repens]|uniref:Nudix hydrolase domain-containing protein n=1 Tax=Absidia repens TaxID=90262 RepID=A0A1X2HZ49_9FUNG|nr:hypothetical protein BCR42DRAFT_427797 [Absidia repens]
MDRPSQTHLYAGLIVYRSLRNIEFLLLNDSFTNKKHWFCPKGLVLGQEDELKCALRETFEATGLGPHLLRIEEGFKIQLRYLSGTKPKKVVYYLAQLVDNHARLLANAEGVHLQWCNQQVASEKAVFKSMQDVFYHAQYHTHQQQHSNGKRYTSGQHLKGNNVTTSSSRPRGHLGETSAVAAATAAKVNNENHSHHQYNTNGNNNSLLLRQNQPRMMDRPSSAPAFRSSASPSQSSSTLSHSVMDGVDNNNNNSNNTNGTNSLFKTRLCERFETDGDCPYGPRCTFAHGIQELRGRLNKDSHGNGGGHHNSTTTTTTAMPLTTSSSDEDDHKENGAHFAKDMTENPLYKTKLCDRFMKDQFCQYGPKCHFAHGRSELKGRPNHHHNHHHHQNQNQNCSHGTDVTTPLRSTASSSEIASVDDTATTTTTSLAHHDVDTKRHTAMEDEMKENNEPRDLANHWRTPTISSNLDSTNETAPASPELRSPLPALSKLSLNSKNHSSRWSPPVQQPTQKKQQHYPPPTAHHQQQTQSEHQSQHYVRPQLQQATQHHTLVNSSPTVKRSNGLDPDQVLNGDIMQTDKSWMKVVHLTKEEQVKLAMPPVTKTPSPTPSKVAQEEAIIDELYVFFQSPESSAMTQQSTQHHLLAKDVKQVTKVEMRNDLTKSQLFYILLASLLQNSSECPVGTILHSREHLFKTFVKSTSDQRILLKAWDRCTQRYPLLLPKSTLVLSQWYECDLLDEEACYVWFDGLDSHGELKKRIVKFIDWLKTADEEDED